ncbi:MAG TPA: TolC family protein [Chitinophagaceae bacterium]|nr:TolC family protein [Chitinophagaceae bacterium]HNU13522.1 TolC family protein [Chitinophagaceae bacterium]
MMKVKSKLWLFGLALLPAAVFAQGSSRSGTDTMKVTKHEFSVQQAIDYAKKNNVNVKNALLDVQYQAQVNREVTSRAYPGINASFGTTFNPNVATQVLPNFISPATYQVLIDEGVKDGNGNTIQMPDDFGFVAAQFGTRYSATAGISLTQILFDGQVFVGLQARDATMRFAKKNVEVTEEMIKSNIYKVYYQLVVGNTQVELLDANIERLEKLLKDTRIIYENGFAEKLDVDKLTVQLTNLQTEKTKVLNTISNGYYGLKVLMGMPVKDELVLTDKLTDEQIKDGMLEGSIYSYEDRKEFQYAQIGKELNEYNIRRYKLSQVPTLSLNGQYAKNAQRNKWNFFGKGDWFTISSVSLNINIPIFNGFYTKSKIEQTKIQLRQTENQIEALKLSIDNEVETARNNFRSAISNMDFQKKNMELAEKVYQQTKKKYEVGTGSQTEINAAQVELKTAQTSYITALYDAIIARIDFLKATGKL